MFEPPGASQVKKSLVKMKGAFGTGEKVERERE